MEHINPWSATLINLFFCQLEAVYHYHESQLQVGKKYLYLYHFIQNICQSCKFQVIFPYIYFLGGQTEGVKTAVGVISSAQESSIYMYVY